MDIWIQFMSLIQIRSWISEFYYSLHFHDFLVDDFQTFYLVGSFFSVAPGQKILKFPSMIE